MPSDSSQFDPAAKLPGGWRVAAYVPGQRLTLARAGSAQLRELGRKMFVTAAAFTLALALAAAARHDPGFTMVIGPVLVLLVIVVVLGLVSVIRTARRATAGSHLAIDVSSGLLTGFLENASGGLVVTRLDQMVAVKLELHRGAGPDARVPKSWATLRVLLTDGRQLDGPEAWGPDEAWEQTRDLLLPAARVLAALNQTPLRVLQHP